MIEKLQDRVPLKSAIGKYSSCLGPHNMINHKDVCILKSKKPLEKLCKNNSMTPVEADNSKNDFPNILTLAQQHQEKFEGFNKHTQRLYSFLAEFVVPNLGQYKHVENLPFYLCPLSWAKPSRKKF